MCCVTPLRLRIRTLTNILIRLLDFFYAPRLLTLVINLAAAVEQHEYATFGLTTRPARHFAYTSPLLYAYLR